VLLKLEFEVYISACTIANYEIIASNLEIGLHAKVAQTLTFLFRVSICLERKGTQIYSIKITPKCNKVLNSDLPLL